MPKTTRKTTVPNFTDNAAESAWWDARQSNVEGEALDREKRLAS